MEDGNKWGFEIHRVILDENWEEIPIYDDVVAVRENLDEAEQFVNMLNEMEPNPFVKYYSFFDVL